MPTGRLKGVEVDLVSSQQDSTGTRNRNGSALYSIEGLWIHPHHQYQRSAVVPLQRIIGQHKKTTTWGYCYIPGKECDAEQSSLRHCPEDIKLLFNRANNAINAIDFCRQSKELVERVFATSTQ